jgi:hypothetical protein
MEILQLSSGRNNWDQSLLDCFHSWIADKTEKAFRASPCFVHWGIWTSRNKMFFQGLELSAAQVAHKIKYAYEGN